MSKTFCGLDGEQDVIGCEGIEKKKKMQKKLKWAIS